MSELVKYHNDINKIPLRNFSEKEINLFFSLIFKAKEEGTNIIKINFIDLRRISNGDINNPRFIKSLINLNNKLLDLKQEINLPDGKILMFNLFNRFVIDPINKNVEIKINEDFYYMLNELLVYTKFELEQLVGLKSSYSKNIFRLLKQFDSTNFFSVYIDEFKRILSIPESYKMSEIDRRVIKPAIKELSPLFPNLKLEKIKEGRRVKSLRFSWANHCLLKPKEGLVIEIKISENLNKAIVKAKKNRFIQPLLTIKNIERLQKKYSDKSLIEGLLFSSKEIKYEVKSLTYLEKTINTGVEVSRKKIVVEPSKSKSNIIDTQDSEKRKNEVKINKTIDLPDEVVKFKKEIDNLAKKKLKEKYFPFKSKLIFANTQEKLTDLIEEYDLNKL